MSKPIERPGKPTLLDHVLVSMDKFRGTATARQLCDSVSKIVARFNSSVDVQPMSDGGEGFRESFMGDVVVVDVPGPTGTMVAAPITLRKSPEGTLAFLEVSEVVGRSHLIEPTSAQAIQASSQGVGYLILAAAQRGASSILIGCGGSSTSDGGLGCYRVLRDAGGLPVAVTAATDVAARFSELIQYAEQKGVSPDDMSVIQQRADDARSLYLAEQGVDVEMLARSGASGGIPGGLAALGAELTSGLNAVVRSVNLDERIGRSSLVITGEGRLDHGSLDGKVTGGIAALLGEDTALLVVCGSIEVAAAQEFTSRYPQANLVSLVDRFDQRTAMTDVFGCVELVVTEELEKHTLWPQTAN
ncbi:MAG: glycerate kinase [Acidimicrobiales bacterium]